MSTADNKQFSFPEVRVVEASAGSGKTYALARRYIQLLINPSLRRDEIPLKNILAITFTNKATLEMKERILEFLKKIALSAFTDKQEEEDIFASLQVPREAARQKAFFIMEYVIRNYNFFQVQTIDSFINTIIAGCSFKLDLSSRFEIKTKYRDYLAYSLDVLIDRANTEQAVFARFRDFLDQYLHIENRPGWFPRDTILELVGELYRNTNTFGKEFHRKAAVTAEELLAQKRKTKTRLKELYAKLPAGTNKRFAEKLGSLVGNNKDTFGFDELSAYFTYEALPVNKGGIVPKDAERLWDAVRSDLERLARAEAYSFFNCYVGVFELVAESVRRLARRDDVMFLEELNKVARELFAGDAAVVPELYYRLATRFRHFLIDEFQDTSELQWQNLLPLVEEALSSGGSLFYVGDKKQAIYRFRGGDATLFDRIPRNLEAFKPRKDILSHNFRSHKEIVEFNNEVFSEQNLQRFIDELQEEEERFSPEGAGEVLEVFADAQQSHSPDKRQGYVRVQHLEARTAEERDGVMKAELLRLVRDLRQRFAYKDIALLARDNRDVELFTEWLLEEKVPVESERTLNVRENPRIKELVSLLIYLNSPIDNLSFASFILSDIFLEATGTPARELREFVFTSNVNRSKDAGDSLYRTFRDAYPRLWDTFFERFFVTTGFVPLYELVVSIYGAFRVMEHFPSHQAFFMRFLELVKKQEKENSSLASFLDYFKEAEDSDLYVTVADTDAVKLLTIHKAKGLEFPAVIVPFLEMDLGGNKGGAPAFEVDREKDALSLVRLSKKYVPYSDELRALARKRFTAAFIDELNTVYVALTRARQELYAFIPKKASQAANPVRALIPEALIERGSPAAAVASASGKTGEPLLLPVSTYKDWLELLKDEFVSAPDLRQRENIRRGVLLHYALSCIGNLHGKDKDAELRRAQERTRSAFPAADTGEMARVLEKMCAGAATRKFFFVPDGEVFREQEIIDAAGAVRRLDRLVVTGGEAWVVDYKSAKDPDGSQRKQVQEYLRIVRDIYPGKTARGFLLYFDTQTVEEVQ